MGMDIRQALNILGNVTETQQETPRARYQSLLEASWKLSYGFGYRSWYLPAENKWIKVMAGSHVKEVLANPAEFGVTPEELEGGTDKDRDPVVMNAVCSKGWIRVAGQDRNNPNVYMIFEGASATQMIKLLRMFYEDQQGKLMNAAIKVRTATGGKEYLMKGNEAVAMAAENGKLPAPMVTDHNDALVQKN